MPWTRQNRFRSAASRLPACELPSQSDSILLIRIWSQTESLSSPLTFHPFNPRTSLNVIYFMFFINLLSPLSVVCVGVGLATESRVAIRGCSPEERLTSHDPSSHPLPLDTQLQWNFLNPSPPHAESLVGCILCRSYVTIALVSIFYQAICCCSSQG